MRYDHRVTTESAANPTAPRPASEAPFPYTSQRVCYIERHPNGMLHQIRTKAQMTAAVQMAKDGEIDIVAVWPGEYRSDLFVIDDLDALAAARKLKLDA